MESNVDLERSYWECYIVSKESVTQNALFTMYHEWAKWLAHMVYKQVNIHGVDIEEFEQYAYEGLLKAIGKFNPNKNIQFKSYAEYRIKGHILNNLPSLSEYSAYYNKIGKIIVKEGGTVSEFDAVSRLVDVVKDLSLQYFLVDKQQGMVSYQGDFYTSPEFKTMSQRVNTVINQLEEPKRGIINSYYNKGMSFSVIADILQLTRGRVSQLHHKSLSEIKEILCW